MTLLAAFQALLHRYSGQDVGAGRHAGRQPRSRRARAADRLLHQHPGDARRPRPRPPPAPSCCGRFAIARSPRSPTRTCPSSASWRSWRRPARPATSRSSRSCSRSRTPRQAASQLEGLEASPISVERDTDDVRPAALRGRAAGRPVPAVPVQQRPLRRGHVARMAGHYRTLLAALAADPSRPIASVDLLNGRRAGRDRGLEPDRHGVRPGRRTAGTHL